MREIALILNHVTDLGDTTTLFKRRNLDINEFIKTSKGLIFEEAFKFKGNDCRFRMIIHGNEPERIFALRNNKISIRGTIHGFSVFANFDPQKVPFQVENKSGCVEVNIKCMDTVNQMKRRRKRGGRASRGKKGPSSYTPYSHTNVSKPYGGM